MLTLLLLVQVALHVVRKLLLLGTFGDGLLLSTLLRHRLGILCVHVQSVIVVHKCAEDYLREIRTTDGKE